MAEPLGQMVIELGLDSSKFGNGLKNAKSQLNYFSNEMKAQSAFYNGFGTKLKAMQAKEQSLTKVISAQSKVVSEINKAYQAAAQGKTKLSTAAARLASNLQREQGKLVTLTKQYIDNAKAMEAMRIKTTGITGAINKMGKAQIAIGSKMKSVGDTATRSISIPLAAAFAGATAKAIAFQNQMTVIKNLLVTGGESTKEAISGVNQMQSDAVKYSNRYGVSVEKISSGYEELIRRGYTSKQAIAAMKTELQGALASGDDFSDVVSVASSTLESFGMKSNSTATMTKNTKIAVNELAYAADLTATDFQSLGVAMSYVGATAHQAHFTLSETASALGVLSNNGVEADKAGTGLRKVIVSLNTAVKNIGTKKDVLGNLGIKKSEIVQSNGQLKNLSTIMNVLNQHTKSMSATKKAAVFNSLFGTTGQQAGIILAQNSKQLAELNSQVDKAEKKNYVGSLSDKNLKSAQNQIKVLRQNLENLGMTIAEKILPSVQPLIKQATSAVDWFSRLNPQIQQNAVKWAALAAALGPVLSIGGRGLIMLGKLGTGTVGAIAKIASWSKGIQLTKSLASVGTEAVEASKGISIMTSSTGGLLSRVGSLSTALGPLAPVIVATATAAGLAAAGWELWGKKAYESEQQTEQWGSGISASAMKSLASMNRFSSGARIALESFNGQTQAVSKNFSGMVKTISASAKAANSKLDQSLKNLPTSVSGLLSNDVAKQKQRNSEIVKNSQDLQQTILRITKQASLEKRKLTTDENTFIENAQRQLNENEINLLQISGQKKKQVLAALNQDINQMSQKQRANAIQSTTQAFNAEQSIYKKQAATLKNLYKSGAISTSDYERAYEQLNRTHNQASNSMILSTYRLMKANKASTAAMNMVFRDMGISYEHAMNVVKSASSKGSQSMGILVRETDSMSSKTKRAANVWNSLVFNVKTGKVKTNAQEEVNKAVSNAHRWNAIKLLALKGKLTSNAKAMVAEALTQTGRWNKISLKTAKLIAQDKTNSAVISALGRMGKWQRLSPKIKRMISQDRTGAALKSALRSIGAWNGLSTRIKRLIARDEASYNARRARAAVDAFRNQTKVATLKTVFVTEYKTTGGKNSTAAGRSSFSAISTSGYARGTNDFKGGLALVNDQKGPKFREAIFDNGRFAIPTGRNVVMSLSKHAQILPARLTEKLFPKIPQFENGLVPSGSVFEMSLQALRRSLSQTTANSIDSSSQLLAGILSQLQDVSIQLAAFSKNDAKKAVQISLDSKTIADGIYPYVDKKMSAKFTKGRFGISG